MISSDTDNGNGLVLCPENVIVIGGGRWARVLTEILYGLLPPSVEISVHSLHNANSMAAWISKRGWTKRINVSSNWPKMLPVRSSAAIVANAARDHERAVDWALSRDIPVLVEKPITLTTDAAQRLVNLAFSRNVCFASAHVFLFARYLENFRKCVSEAEAIRFIRVCWEDPKNEVRYGENKQYDPGLPVFADWLPHVLSIVGTISSCLPQSCEHLKFLKGGAHLELELKLDHIPCNVQLVRNSNRRLRFIEATTEKKVLKIDFSKEPGIIIDGSTIMGADPDWNEKSRPAARMLTAFLHWVAGGEFDNRLNIEIGLQASRVIDQTLSLYRSSQIRWLIDRFISRKQVDDDLRYALIEILQSERYLPMTAIERQIERLMQRISGTDATRWLRVLAKAQDPLMVIKTMAM